MLHVLWVNNKPTIRQVQREALMTASFSHRHNVRPLNTNGTEGDFVHFLNPFFTAREVNKRYKSP